MRTCLSIMVRDRAGVFIQDSLSLKLDVSHSTPSPLVGVCVFPSQLRLVDGSVFSAWRIKEKNLWEKYSCLCPTWSL